MFGPIIMKFVTKPSNQLDLNILGAQRTVTTINNDERRTQLFLFVKLFFLLPHAITCVCLFIRKKPDVVPK